MPFSKEHVEMVAYLAASIAFVGGGVMWFENRMDRKLAAYGNLWAERMEDHEARANERTDLLHQALLAEIQHLREEIRAVSRE